MKVIRPIADGDGLVYGYQTDDNIRLLERPVTMKAFNEWVRSK